jgi:hypothetical protein
MANLRLIDARAAESRIIKAKFTANLTDKLTVDNVSVIGMSTGVPDAEVLSLAVDQDILTINVLPLTPYGQYQLQFKSTTNNPFTSADGRFLLFEDGKTNVKNILGAENPSNQIRNNLISQLKDNIYNLDRGTFIREVLNQVSSNILKAKYDVGQTKNENYLSFTVFDERKSRGNGPFDHLAEEGAYEIIRVGKNPTNATVQNVFSYTSFPFDIITLQAVQTSESLEAANDGAGTFNKLVLTLSNNPITIINSINIKYQDTTTYDYDIRNMGYRINNPIYDTLFASALLTLGDNQVQLNETILEDPLFKIPGNGDIINVSYQFKSLGRDVDDDSVEVVEIIDSVREATPALTNQFTLQNFPVVNNNGNVASSNGIVFLDPHSETPFLTIHPAFTKELPFRFEALPSNPGEYSVDYGSSKVYVFGADASGTGTGNFPPAATYKYLKTYSKGLDYTYNDPTSNLVANPLRDLIGKIVKIRFNFQQNLVPDVDFQGLVHKEIIDERIENRIKSTNSVSINNTPLTNVFRIFNETTQESYALTRFNNDTIYFSSNTPPNIQDKKRERANFQRVTNELLIKSNQLTNILGTKIFIVNLLNHNIISATEDVIGSSFNSSVIFSRNDIFETELYYDSQVLNITNNINKILVGEYQIDYLNGIVYVGVSLTQNLDIGTIYYKAPIIVPNNPHIISVSELYNSLNPNTGISKLLNYISFSEGEIIPSAFDRSDERFFNNNFSDPYVYNNGTITVTDDIKSIRHIFDVYNLNNSIAPIDFGPSATSQANIITLDSVGIERREVLVVQPGLELDVSQISPGIVLSTAINAIRLSDNVELLDGYETLLNNTITLAVSSGAVVGDVVDVLYTVVLNGASTPVVDYDRGGYYIDYTYLADEILVSYEYGDNNLDFRTSKALNEGDTYYVSYKVGALRDSLLSNFGSLVDIAEFKSFDINLNREIYRSALIGALQSFTKGPTIPAMQQIVFNITKIIPEIIESAFQVWSLGYSHLYGNPIEIGGDLQLVPGKFDQGILPVNDYEFVTFPVVGNLRLEEGTLETWVIPEWNGIDNDATLTFSNLTKNGLPLSSDDIYIGASGYHPDIVDNSFLLNRLDPKDPVGLPAIIHTATAGIFIYYDSDISAWNFYAKDIPSGHIYAGNIQSSGEVYNVKFIEDLGEPNDSLRSGLSSIDFEFNLDGLDASSPDGYATGDGYVPPYSFDGITFMADEQHYIFDFADKKDKNRFSIYKDGRGYLNFSVWDKGPTIIQEPNRRNSYTVSADISNWKSGEKHHVAVAWRLNSSDRRDEMHLFIDGVETSNILLYGGRPKSSSTDRFRTIKPELVIGTVLLKAISGNDLVTAAGSNIVYSPSNNFTIDGITPGNTIKINELGFTTYNITGVFGDTLILDTNMPASLSDARFSVNPFSNIVASQINLYKNIAVSIVRGGVETEIPGVRADIPGYEISKNAFNQDVLTILGDVDPGDAVYLRTLGLNYRRVRDKSFTWGNTQSVLRTHLPPPINLDEVSIKKVITPLTTIGPNNAIIVLGNFVASIDYTQPTNQTEGRQITVRVTGGNVDFSTPTDVTITGVTTGPPSETLLFSAPGELTTINKFLSISNITVTTTPFSTVTDGLSVEIKEAFSVTESNGNNIYPVIRFAFKTQSGTALTGDGSDIVENLDGFFPESDVDNLLVISTPGPVVGTYTITERINNTSVRVTPTPAAAFVGGSYDVYNVSIGRSGFQNGFFFLEIAGSSNIGFPLTEGYYEFDYSSYLDIAFDPLKKQNAFIGSDYLGKKQAKAIIDEFRILNYMLTDTRIGESISLNEYSVTTDYNSLTEYRKNNETLMLLHFNSKPFVNDSDYIVFSEGENISSAISVNQNFGRSIFIKERGLEYENQGSLTNTEGTIEFWVSPKFDTYNDPVPRFYFDATAATIENSVSLTTTIAKTDGRIAQVVSVRLLSDTGNIGEEYFAGGTIENDRQTLRLKKALPHPQTPIKIAYIPSGTLGDRISIFKDSEGFITLNVRASGQDYQVRQPVFWERDSWHRVMATYKFNRRDNLDQIRLFVDREERGVILFGSGLLFGAGAIFGQTTVGVTNQILIANIDFTDTITKFYIGQEFTGAHTAQAKMDNIRLSNVSREPLVVAGQPLDVNYSNNLDVVFPVIEDAFTTFLLDFTQLAYKTTDFSILQDAEFGIYNFTLNIIDSFRIVESSDRVKNLLESMIFALKPATSKVDINYIT